MSKTKGLKNVLIPFLFLNSSLASAGLTEDLKKMGTDVVCTPKYLISELLSPNLKFKTRGEKIPGGFLRFSHIEYHERVDDISINLDKESFNKYKNECPLKFDYNDLEKQLTELELCVLNGELELSYREQSGYYFCKSLACESTPVHNPKEYDQRNLIFRSSSQDQLKQSVSEFIEELYK